MSGTKLDVNLIIDALQDYRQWYTMEDASVDDQQKAQDIDAELEKLYSVEEIEI